MTDVQATDRGPLPTPAVCEESVRTGNGAPRRVVLLGAGAVGATCVLSACGSSGNPNGSDFNDNPAPAGSAAGTDAPSGTVLVAAADVPVGGGIIKGAFVITQPSQGAFKAFSKVCTHQGCDVNRVDGGVIMCPCHGSRYSIEDGSVQVGPAPRPLPETTVKVSGSNVVKA